MVCLFFLLVAAAGCGGGDSGSPPDGSTIPAPASPSDYGGADGAPGPPPSTRGTGTPNSVLDQVRERCADTTETLDEAFVRFDDRMELQTGEQTTFQLTVEVADDPTGSSDGPVQGRVGIACQVEARLVVTGDVVSVAPSDWQSDKYVPPDPVRWSWAVEASTPGTAVGSLELRPVVRISDESGAVREEDLQTVEYVVTFSVTRSREDAVGRVWKQVAAGAGLVVTVLTAVSVVYTLRRRNGASADGA